MSSIEPTPQSPPDAQVYDPTDPAHRAREAAARQRVLFLGLFRLSGALIVAFGFAIGMERFDWVAGNKAKILGAIVITVGMFQWVFVPRILKSAWRTPTA